MSTEDLTSWIGRSRVTRDTLDAGQLEKIAATFDCPVPAVGKLIGGQYFTYRMRGDAQEDARPVAVARQRKPGKALDLGVAGKVHVQQVGIGAVGAGDRTAATTPARLKASARLFRTIIAMPVTTIGRIMMVCRKDWSMRRARLVMK